MIYYDITDLLRYFDEHPHVTGIQRVTIATIRQFLELADAEGTGETLGLIAYDPTLGRAMATDAGFFRQENLIGSQIRAYFELKGTSEADQFDAYLNARYKRRWPRRFHRYRMLLENRLTRGKTFRKKGIMVRGADLGVVAKAAWRPTAFSANDVIYISGATWIDRAQIAELGRLRDAHGVKIVHLIYDLIPIKNPEFVSGGSSSNFEDWLVRLNRIADAIVTNAEVTRRDLESFAERSRLPPFRNIRVIPLAHEFLQPKQDAERPPLGENAPYAKVRPHVFEAARLPYALAVGTLDARKNNWGLAQVWESLRKKYGYTLPRLVFVGRKGWLSDQFFALLERTHELDGHIIVLEDATDDELAHLYKNCLFSVFPSFAEGWGLPVGESLWFGRPVITSDISSIPEVAGPYADYIDPFDLTTLEKAVEKMLDPTYRETRVETIRSMSLRAWKDVAEDIWKTLHSI